MAYLKFISIVLLLQTVRALSYWCITMPPMTLEAVFKEVNNICASGEERSCVDIQEAGPCFFWGDLYRRASHVFNTIYQRNPSPGNCVFGGLAFLINIDPSTGSCIFQTSNTSMPDLASAASPPTTITTPPLHLLLLPPPPVLHFGFQLLELQLYLFFPMLGHPRRGNGDGQHNFSFGEHMTRPLHNHIKSDDAFGKDGPVPLGRVNFSGPGYLPGHFMSEAAGPGIFSVNSHAGELGGPGNFNHRIGESVRCDIPSITPIGEPGIRSNYPLQGFPNPGAFAGKVDSFLSVKEEEAY